MSSTTQTKTEAGERICWKCGSTFSADVEVCPEDGSRLLMLDSDREDPLIGALFDGRFRVYKKLGEGGMGNVYSARQVDFERDVALKILKADFLRDDNIRKRFMYEARAISNLSHPHALRLFDFGQAPDGSFYMVMELLEGESLADRLAYKFVTFREVFNIVPPVCGVLHEAHKNKVIHRDLKPENIYIVDVNGTEEFTKLLDFGIAKHLQDRTMTRSGTLWGTPAYMSPEQAKGETVGGPADIYAIGIILFELISGNLPFASETQMGLAMKHINVPARSLRSIPGLAGVVPESLDQLVMECLAKNPDDRPPDAQTVADRLNAILDEDFDDARLEAVPAEEVDAIALQDWIAAEPKVSSESIVKPAIPRPPSTPASPVTFNSPPARSPVPTAPGPPSISTESNEIAAESAEDLAIQSGPPMGIIIGAVAILTVGVVGLVAFSGDDAARAAADAAAVTANAEQQVEAASEEAAGTAGVAASNAASVVMHARRLTEALDDADSLAEEIAAEPQAKPAREETKQDLDDVKPAIESTF